MKNKKLKFNLAIPKTPREFYCEVSNLLLTIEAIKKVAKDFNCNYKLDYLNAKVSFINKN